MKNSGTTIFMCIVSCAHLAADGAHRTERTVAHVTDRVVTPQVRQLLARSLDAQHTARERRRGAHDAVVAWMLKTDKWATFAQTDGGSRAPLITLLITSGPARGGRAVDL